MRPRALQIIWGVLTLASLWVFINILLWTYQYFQNPSARQLRGLAELGLSPTIFFALNILYVCIVYLTFFIVAQLIMLRRSHRWFSLLAAVVLLSFGTSNAVPPILEAFEFYLAMPPIIGIPYNLLNFLGWTLLSAFVISYPDGTFFPRWSLSFAVLGFILSALWTTNAEAFSTPQGVWAVLLLLVVAVGYGGMILVQIWRYRNYYSLLQKQQVKWFVLGVAGVLITVLPGVILSPIFLDPNIPPQELLKGELIFFGVGLGMLALPLSVGAAILRYRLWDIDILIRKTLTYALVVVLLAVVYFGSVVLLQQVFASVTGQRNEIITVLSTLAIAALFVPLRNRIQDLIDRRFYRKKYDAQLVLQSFGESVRDETDLEHLTGRLMEVVNETMQPKSMSVWLQKDKPGDRA